MSTGNGVPVFTDSDGRRLRTTTWVARGIVAVVSLGLVALAASVLIGVPAPTSTSPTSVGSTHLKPSIAPSVPGQVPPLSGTTSRSTAPRVVVSTAGPDDEPLTAPGTIEQEPLSTSPQVTSPPAADSPPPPISSSSSSSSPPAESPSPSPDEPTTKPGKGNQTTKPKPRDG